MTNFILTALMVAAPMEDEKLVRTEVVVVIGNGKFVEDPKKSCHDLRPGHGRQGPVPQ